jgi:hypothetical protein
MPEVKRNYFVALLEWQLCGTEREKGPGSASGRNMRVSWHPEPAAVEMAGYRRIALASIQGARFGRPTTASTENSGAPVWANGWQTGYSMR